MDDDTLTKAIIGTIGDVDSYQLPDAKGYSRYANDMFCSTVNKFDQLVLLPAFSNYFCYSYHLPIMFTSIISFTVCCGTCLVSQKKKGKGDGKRYYLLGEDSDS